MNSISSSLTLGVMGYWVARADGVTQAFGAADSYGVAGSVADVRGGDVVSVATAGPDSRGNWLAAADGGVFCFGEAPFHGSLPASGVSARVVSMAVMPDSSGYWLTGADGGVFTFGEAPFHGSLPALGVSAEIVGMATMPDCSGYWLAGADGGVFCFGEAPFHGSLPALGLSQRVVGMAAMPDGSGYWLVGEDGGVFAFGDAPFHGSVPGAGVRTSIAGMAAVPDGSGYLLVGRDGAVYPFGAAAFHGSAKGHGSRASAVGLALCANERGMLGTRAAGLLRALQTRLGDESGSRIDAGHTGRFFPIGGITLPATGTSRASIVIPVHGCSMLTTNCLASIAAVGSSVPFEVIVVDDDSPDDTAAMLRRVKNVKVVRNDENLGFTKACNAGIAAASGEYVVLLNNDTEVTPGWLEELVGTADADPTIALVGSKLVFDDGTLQEAGGIVWSDATGHNYGRGADPGAPFYNYVRDVDYCSGASLLIRKSLLDELGGLDERYAPAYYEDTDLAFAARAMGGRVVYQPRSVVVHHEGGSHGTDISSGVKRFQEVNRAVFSAKWKDALAVQRRAGTSLVLARDTRRGPRALVVDHMVPLYDQDSGSVRMLGLVSLLVDLGFVVTFVPANWTALQPYADRLQQMGVEVLYGPMDFAAHVAAMGEELKLCILSRPSVACQFIGTIRANAAAATVVYDTVDLHFLRERRCGELSDSDSLLRVARATREIELGMVRATDMTFSVTSEERDVILGEVPEASVHVIPNIHEPHAVPLGPSHRKGLLFVGSYQHEPNRDAVHHLVKDIMPLIRGLIPGVHLVIAGSSPTRDVLALAGPDVEVLGWVPDLTPLYETARVFVAPLRFGAGMKGKIGETLTQGLPAVTTKIGAEGMGLVNGRDILVADDADDFAQQVARLHEDDALWSRVAEQGRSIICERYAPAAVREQLRRVFTEAGVLAVTPAQNSVTDAPTSHVPPMETTP